MYGGGGGDTDTVTNLICITKRLICLYLSYGKIVKGIFIAKLKYRGVGNVYNVIYFFRI